MCERLHCLPNAGGLFQQDENHLKRMEKVIIANDKLNEKKAEAATRKVEKPDESI